MWNIQRSNMHAEFVDRTIKTNKRNKLIPWDGHYQLLSATVGYELTCHAPIKILRAQRKLERKILNRMCLFLMHWVLK
jgi:hypothetical protein